jgi:hypothetical protein
MEYPMKKTTLILASLLLILTLVACNGNSTEGETQTTSSDNSSNPEFEMPLEMQLMMGTVMLDKTEYAVDANQASQLIPLWKALRSLGESETAAQAEIDAVIAQIEDTMTRKQMDTIEGMELTMQDMSTITEILGIETGFGGGRFGEISPEMQETMEAARESGEFPGGGQGPGGGFPGGGFGPGGGQFGGAEIDPEARATAIAERGGTRGAGFGINTTFLDAIIEFLEAKIE